MGINKDDYRKVNYRYNGQHLYFSKNHVFHLHFKHRRRTFKFPYHKNLLDFLKDNPEWNVFFTADISIKPFKRYGNDFLINIDSYLEFCESMQGKTDGRAKAFLGQNLKLIDIATSQEEKDDFIKVNANEKNILGAIKSLNEESKKNIVQELSKFEVSRVDSEISSEKFAATFVKFLTDKNVQQVLFDNLPRIQIETLKSHIDFLEKALGHNETYVQEWIDEENGKYRKQRCLIFGIEFVDPKREGKLNEKRFDILAEQNRESHILIELKSPGHNIFDIKETPNKNGGVSTQYTISTHLSRAIPQILGYKDWYESASLEEIQALGIESKRSISKCIIVIGQNKQDNVWRENFRRLKANINIEVLTYNDLIDKLKNSIKNLEENLN